MQTKRKYSKPMITGYEIDNTISLIMTSFANPGDTTGPNNRPTIPTQLSSFEFSGFEDTSCGGENPFEIQSFR